jgi:hypothetical protein
MAIRFRPGTRPVTATIPFQFRRILNGLTARVTPPRTCRRFLVALFVAAPAVAFAQTSAPETRTAEIERAQAAKASTLHPYEPTRGEKYAERVQRIIEGGALRWHPFFQSAYSGGGFTLGAGYAQFVSPYNLLDMRGSYTFAGYKRIETEFIAPRLFERRGAVSVLGGWREATQVGFYGLGPQSSKDDRVNYAFRQPYVSSLLTVRPTRRILLLRGGLEWSQWAQRPGQDGAPSVETRYTPASLPGVGATVSYWHTQATVALDSRTSPGYSRRGTFLGVTGHDYTDDDREFGFQRVDYEAIQHVPILRETWVISLHGLASTAYAKNGQDIPFFMLPSLGGGSNLRGYSSWRFRDRASLLLQAEWRIMVNRFLDTAIFYDSGQVGSRLWDLDFSEQRRDYGFGVRFHGPFATPLRIDIARSREGFRFVFAAGAAF